MPVENSKALIMSLPTRPGIYRMLGGKGEVLYVGKARNLRKRVQSYFRASGLAARVLLLMHQAQDLEITVTHTETEALLLENNLIKTLHPRFNILLRDDKSYPYIFVSDGQEYPRIGFHRGAKREKGRYFGPYPSSYGVRETLNLLQKIFRVRQCQDSFFRNRSRPCLQYQIKRCSGPCVGLVEPERYRRDVRQALMFMEGKSQSLIRDGIKQMEQASDRQDYETAALLRDRIGMLKRIQEKQYISGAGGDADVLAVAATPEAACIVVTWIRGGQNLGSKSFFPRMGAESAPAEILAAFLAQYYLSGRAIPARVYLGEAIADRALLERAFTEKAGKKIALAVGPRGAPRRWVQMAKLNADEALRRHLAGKIDMQGRFEALRDALKLESTPERIECFDISHTMGEATVAACVVFDMNGPVKSDYRRFNIEGIEPGDDYGAMTQALTRRYRKVKEGEGRLPDLLLIDGGKGQLSVAEGVMQELQLAGVKLVGVAKGRERKPGQEQLFLSGSGRPTILPPTSAGLHLIQQIRDEAHRFAIAGHRARRGKARTSSTIERIPGIGGKRRQALLKNFGGLREVARAGVEDLARVPGISPQLAQKIYDAFHGEE
ncbi:MAG: excinuclease ABC subunit C [Candidatus Muproteobacteria bacterium RIFCSPHIGHO2_12_FULL_60_33]|uniref:UvrABC system protein C n=1 Tax=Candidatus Muproteobacteria bacterium RIFCSPLOWO2_01_FULL_60_18 TaxID=1817768 RepID=A0A1F6TYP4_9PROT|nr:MAG: excinuclease ABC subunit C [Candidatus Muproteobacteria bacterium RIFCSPLOWO2_01_FULL_60_18]OGI52531.1 MAG: excinuclease ABC subunit C [Candidatus Muproteobacteria bacterium RIFCSPHIGHO2_01_60_12]OGI53947.1 MAG: excinuclease ABC subunit C [Candidatus Muproteobacteria bacterium RIFCSPHIGHO2_12_FULL_60_33]OGI56943.1 MAG: excinuclease ABC subunit C [Candidatus Muproteobacteria bacterium RIFCSPHIGHO2_02_FULL_60_13]